MVGILTGLPEGWISLSLFVGDAVMKRILSHSDIQVGELEPADGLVHVVDRTGDDLGIQRVVQALQELRLDGRLDHSGASGVHTFMASNFRYLSTFSSSEIRMP